MAGGASEPGRSVLDRALAVLGSFSDERPEQTLGQIVAATGLAAATAHRLVAELVAWGALERPGRGRYRIGIRLWQIGALAPLARPASRAAHRALWVLRILLGVFFVVGGSRSAPGSPAAIGDCRIPETAPPPHSRRGCRFREPRPVSARVSAPRWRTSRR